MMRMSLLILGLLTGFVTIAQDSVPPVPVLKAKLAVVKEDSARVDVLFDLAQAYLDQVADDRPSLDTAFQVIAQAAAAPVTQTDPRLKGLSELMVTRAYRVGSQPMHDSAVRHAMIAIGLLHGYPFLWAQACFEAGVVFLNAKDAHEDSLMPLYFKKAIPVFDSLGRTRWAAQSLEFLGGSLHNPKEALPFLQQSLAKYKSVPHPDLRRLLSRIALSYRTLGDNQQAIHYALLAVRAEDSLPEPDHNSVLTFNTAAVCYARLQDYNRSVFYITRALDLSIKYHDLNAIQTNAYVLARDYFLLGAYDSALAVRRRIIAAYPPRILIEKVFATEIPAMVFQKLGRMDSLDVYEQQLAKLDLQIGHDHVNRTHTLPWMIDYTRRSHQYPPMQQYCRELIRVGRFQGQKEMTAIGYQNLATADSALGDHRSAMQDYRQYIELRDSIRNADNAKQIAALTLQYDAEKKDKDILSLKHNQQLDEIALHQASLTRNFIVSGVVLLLVLLGVAINRYRLKQRSNVQLSRLVSEKEGLILEKDGLITEKEWLLKEIHHRVKNNLQIGISLLGLQSFHIENEAAQSAIRQSRNRMYAMSLIHQRLYQGEDLKTIDMRQYVDELVDCIRDSYSSEKKIDFELTVQRLQFGVEHALPIGLILNETITNSLKYAFPDRSSGRIIVRLEAEGDEIVLLVADNGVGMPEGYDPGQNQSLGMQLIRMLVEQLEGGLAMTNDFGLAVTIVFPKPAVVCTDGKHALYSSPQH